MRTFLKILAVALALVAIFVGFIFYRIYSLRPVGHETTQALFAAIGSHDVEGANAVFAPELLQQFPDAAQKFLPYVQVIASIGDYPEWFIGGYSFGLGGEKYTYRFLITYTDGTKGKGITKFIRRNGGPWLIYSLDLSPDKE